MFFKRKVKSNLKDFLLDIEFIMASSTLLITKWNSAVEARRLLKESEKQEISASFIRLGAAIREVEEISREIRMQVFTLDEK